MRFNRLMIPRQGMKPAAAIRRKENQMQIDIEKKTVTFTLEELVERRNELLRNEQKAKKMANEDSITAIRNMHEIDRLKAQGGKEVLDEFFWDLSHTFSDAENEITVEALLETAGQDISGIW
jgi:hypothetical protein